MDLAEKIIEGDIRAASRLMRDIDDRIPTAVETLKKIYPKTGKAYVVGITGAPGTGKSTLVNTLSRRYRERGLTVGIVAVDPTSPFTGGALLGDRLRMRDLAGDACRFGSLHYDDWLAAYEGLRVSTARLINAERSEIAIVKNTSEGIATVALGVDPDATPRLL